MHVHEVPVFFLNDSGRKFIHGRDPATAASLRFSKPSPANNRRRPFADAARGIAAVFVSALGAATYIGKFLTQRVRSLDLAIENIGHIEPALQSPFGASQRYQQTLCGRPSTGFVIFCNIAVHS
ncbi:hypothetical protein [Paraburkholderia aspalathi]|uniref:hypothetical protein n=1 Tax=Paraburkholderia aspalathi TaxID=1324617 RepID=UPI0038B9D007